VGFASSTMYLEVLSTRLATMSLTKPRMKLAREWGCSANPVADIPDHCDGFCSPLRASNGKSVGEIARPARFKRATCAFRRANPNQPSVYRRRNLKGWMRHDGFHEIGGETMVFGRSSNGGFWSRKIENPLSFNED
jgi:hypothetical protein